MTTVESVLRQYGNGLAPNDFAKELERVLRQRQRADSRALTEHDAHLLTAIGVP